VLRACPQADSSRAGSVVSIPRRSGWIRPAFQSLRRLVPRNDVLGSRTSHKGPPGPARPFRSGLCLNK